MFWWSVLYVLYAVCCCSVVLYTKQMFKCEIFACMHRIEGKTKRIVYWFYSTIEIYYRTEYLLEPKKKCRTNTNEQSEASEEQKEQTTTGTNKLKCLFLKQNLWLILLLLLLLLPLCYSSGFWAPNIGHILYINIQKRWYWKMENDGWLVLVCKFLKNKNSRFRSRTIPIDYWTFLRYLIMCVFILWGTFEYGILIFLLWRHAVTVVYSMNKKESKFNIEIWLCCFDGNYAVLFATLNGKLWEERDRSIVYVKIVILLNSISHEI